MSVVNVSKLTPLKKFVNYAEDIISHLKELGLEMFKKEDFQWDCREDRLGHANAYITLYDLTEQIGKISFFVGLYSHISTNRILAGKIKNPLEGNAVEKTLGKIEKMYPLSKLSIKYMVSSEDAFPDIEPAEKVAEHIFLAVKYYNEAFGPNTTEKMKKIEIEINKNIETETTKIANQFYKD